MAFTPGRYQQSPLLTAYATQRELDQTDRGLDQTDRQMDQKDTEMEIDKAYKEGLISNQEKQILIDRNRLEFQERKYDTTGKLLDQANIEQINSATAINKDNLETKQLDRKLQNIQSDATSMLNEHFQLGDIDAKDLITYDSDTGQFGWHEDFTAENYGVSRNANDMRKTLIDDLQSKYTNLDPTEINRMVNENWDSIYGENMNAYYNDLNQYLSQAWQDEQGNADADGDGTISSEEQNAWNNKLTEFIGTSPQFRNVMAPGLINTGMDPSALMYNISGHNVPVTSDSETYKDVLSKSKGFTWKLELDDDGNMSWKKQVNTGSGTSTSSTSQSGHTILGRNPADDDEALINSPYTGVGKNWNALYNTSNIKPSQVDEAQNLLDRAVNDQARSMITDDVDKITVVEKGGKLYAQEKDSWFGQDDEIPIIEKDGILYLQWGSTSNPTYTPINNLNDKTLRNIFEKSY